MLQLLVLVLLLPGGAPFRLLPVGGALPGEASTPPPASTLPLSGRGDVVVAAPAAPLLGEQPSMRDRKLLPCGSREPLLPAGGLEEEPLLSPVCSVLGAGAGVSVC
jgi:hypothetical protein